MPGNEDFPLVCLLALGLAVPTARAQFPDFPTADRVLGQSNFTSNTAPAASQSSMNSPAGVAVDPVSGKVFVSLTGQNRILRFANSASLASGANAEAVIGQTTYSSVGFGTSATTLRGPGGIDIDRLGRLWVADFTNHRVLMYEDAANLPEFGAAADLVLGQPDFNTGTAATSQTKMRGPAGVHLDTADNLWVADFDNNRVLKFANVSSLANGAAATIVLGQPDFDTATSGATNSKMASPAAVLVDGAGRLWVADQSNHRVLRFDGAAGLGNTAAANGVLGQVDFTSFAQGSTPEKMDQPNALAVDRAGTLYISDYFNSRVIYHKGPASKADGAIPDGVIGQPDLATTSTGTTAQKLGFPYGGLDVDAAGNLWVADYSNHRVLRFPGDFTARPPTVTGRVPKTTTRATLRLRGTATDPSGVASVKYRVGTRGAYRPAVGTTTWRLTARLKPGRNTIEITVTDSFGNTSTAKRVRVKRL